MFMVGDISKCFLKVSSTQQKLHLFGKKYIKKLTLWNISAILNNYLLFEYILKCNFQHNYSSLQCHMILLKSL